MKKVRPMPRRPAVPNTPQPKLSDIGRLDSVCPHCGEHLERRPERKAACPHCGEWIFVRTRPLDRQRVLLTEPETSKVEAEWARFQIWSKRTKSRGG
jgi:DNA-directed RNA polymerase subunit RPC12/RpoP